MAYIKSEEKNFFIPYYTRLGIPYYDNEYKAFAFQEEGQSLVWLSKIDNKDITIEEKLFTKEKLYTLCYQIGAKSLVIDWKEKKTEVSLNERMKEISNGYYNSRLNRDIIKLLETKHTEYLEDIAKCRFLVAANIQKPFDIVYAVAKSKTDGRYYYIAFSTLSEFDTWKTDNKWQPVEVDFKALTSISHKHPFIINPKGIKLVLSSEQINKIGGRT